MKITPHGGPKKIYIYSWRGLVKYASICELNVWLLCSFADVQVACQGYQMSTRRRHTHDTNWNQQYPSQTNWTVTTHTVEQEKGRTIAPFEQEMTCRDRTQEFNSAIKSLQSRQVHVHVCRWSFYEFKGTISSRSTGHGIGVLVID